MYKKLKESLHFLRLIDENNVLSITNIGCIIVLVKVALNPNPSIFEMGSLLVTLSSYYAKKHLASRQQKITDENRQAIADLSTKVGQIADKASGLAMHVGLRGNPLINK